MRTPSAIGPAGRRRYSEQLFRCAGLTILKHHSASDNARMNLRRRQIVIAIAVFIMGIAVLFSSLSATKRCEPANTPMDEPKRALHALNRLAFGPRPGDVERVTAMGVDKWIDQQLHPGKIDDHALDARLEPFRTLRMNTREIVENFPPPAVIKAIADGKQSMPSDSARRAVYEAQLERYQQKKEQKQEAANTAPVVWRRIRQGSHDERRRIAPAAARTASMPISKLKTCSTCHPMNA